MIDAIRSLLQRPGPDEEGVIRKPARCSCGYRPAGCASPRRSVHLDDEDHDRVANVEETDAAIIRTMQRVVVFRCQDCGERFTYEPTFATYTDTEFKD